MHIQIIIAHFEDHFEVLSFLLAEDLQIHVEVEAVVNIAWVLVFDED